MSRDANLARSKNPKPALANNREDPITAFEILNYPGRTFCDISFVTSNRIPELQKEERGVIKYYLIISMAGSLTSQPVLAAEPFMDSAPGHCFLCKLTTSSSIVEPRADDCPKPDQISRSYPNEQREARSDSRVTD